MQESNKQPAVITEERLMEARAREKIAREQLERELRETQKRVRPSYPDKVVITI